MAFPRLEDIKKRRRLAGITQHQLAKLCGLSQSFITKIESGSVEPSYSKAQAIFGALERLERKGEKKATDIMAKSVKSVGVSDSVKSAIGLMKRNGISQLPVFDGKTPVGSISEKTIVDKMGEEGFGIKDIEKADVKEIMDEALPILKCDTPISVVSPVLQYSQAVLISEKGKIVGIITKADLLK